MKVTKTTSYNTRLKKIEKELLSLKTRIYPKLVVPSEFLNEDNVVDTIILNGGDTLDLTRLNPTLKWKIDIVYGDYDDPPDIELNGITDSPVPNRNYEKELKSYNEKYKKLKIKKEADRKRIEELTEEIKSISKEVRKEQYEKLKKEFGE